MPLYFGMVDKEYKEIVTTNLAKELKRNNFALTSGDVGYRYLLQVLNKAGYSDIIYKMNSRSDVPGYGYQLEKGATSLTESWKAEGASHNHMMLGHLMEWLYSGLGGIRQSESSVAFKEIVIKPEFVDDLTFVTTGFESPYGPINCKWEKQDNVLNLTIDIPVNTTAIIYLDKKNNSIISEGNTKIRKAEGIEIESENDEQMICKVGSGKYLFRIEN